MSTPFEDYPLVIVGAGAAGLGASEQAQNLGVSHIVVEASHRTGGRGLTEYLEDDIPVDLGCHWMHSASINPYVEWANVFALDYDQSGYGYRVYRNGQHSGESAEFENFRAKCEQQIQETYRRDPGSPVSDAIDLDHPWADFYCYWMSLMHSNDVDQVSVKDAVEYHDTGEDWSVRQGYGALIARQGRDAPVRCNTAVESIDYRGKSVGVGTSQGRITAQKVIVTVSTGVLGAQQIAFDPQLPSAKLEAIFALPLGNSNYQFFSIAPESIDAETVKNIHYQNHEVSMAIRVRPFDTPCVFTSTGGRFAWWLENQGVEASRDYFEQALVDVFGTGIRKGLNQFKVSAWGYDPWIRGAYSSLAPGYGDMRKVLAEPVNESLYFAGEATSSEFMNTAHGAYLSGKSAVNAAFPDAAG